MDLDRSRVGRIAFHLLRGTLGLASATFGLVVVGVAIYALYQWIVPAWQKMLTNPSPETSTIVLIVFTLMALFFLAFGVTITASVSRSCSRGRRRPPGSSTGGSARPRSVHRGDSRAGRNRETSPSSSRPARQVAGCS